MVSVVPGIGIDIQQARCDIESMQYSYQFDAALAQEWNWSEKYSPQPEILSYAEYVAERLKLKSDIDFNARINQATFDDESATWRLESEDGRARGRRVTSYSPPDVCRCRIGRR